MKSKAVEILELVKKVLIENPELGEITPTMYDTVKFANKPSIGLFENTDKGLRLRFTITVEDLKEDNNE